MDKGGDVVLDIERLAQQSDLCCSKALSRKGSIRMDKRIGEDKEADDSVKKLIVKAVASQMEQLKQPLVPFKTLQTVQSAPSNPVFPDFGDGRSKRLHRLSIINPRKILLFFATIILSPGEINEQVEHRYNDSHIFHTSDQQKRWRLKSDLRDFRQDVGNITHPWGHHLFPQGGSQNNFVHFSSSYYW